MSSRRIALLFALAASLAACRGGWERMVVQQKALPFEESSLFADGKAMRQPPEGTVPRERESGDAAFLTGALDGKLLSRIPIATDAALLARGRDRYEISCAACHGEAGDGQSAVAAKMSLVPPPSLHDFRARPDGFFFQVITQGFGVMPSYGDRLDARDRWAIVAYVRALQLSRLAPLSAVPAAERARLEGETR